MSYAPSLRRRGEALALAATLALPVAVLAISRAYTVNIGYYDDWQWTPMILDMRHGTIPWASMWALHNNHRIVVPDVVALAIARFGSWSSVRETTFSVGIAVLTQLVWYAVVARAVPAQRRVAAFFLISLLVFSLAQSENWIWGFQIAWFIANLAIAAMVYCLTFRGGVRWAAAALACALIAAHSIAYGLDALLAGTVVAALERPRSKVKLVAWIVATVAVWGSYAHDYTRGLTYAPASAGLERAAQTIVYALAFLGAPVARSLGPAVCALVGAIALGAYAWCIVAWLRGDRSDGGRRHAVLVVLATGLVPVLCALQIAYARLWEGPATALSGRYVMASSLLWIVVIVAGAAGRVTLPRTKAAGAVAVAVCLAGWAGAQWTGFDDIRSRALDIYAAGQALPSYATATADELKWLFPAEVFAPALDAAKEGPFAEPARAR